MVKSPRCSVCIVPHVAGSTPPSVYYTCTSIIMLVLILVFSSLLASRAVDSVDICFITDYACHDILWTISAAVANSKIATACSLFPLSNPVPCSKLDSILKHPMQGCFNLVGDIGFACHFALSGLKPFIRPSKENIACHWQPMPLGSKPMS